ncbi:MAG: class I SAM-dependent methyltransferase [gamma proteobacterium symbiont of Taylorina sp.]|nr:class I SAM-dependent methyltransferase [gamma proteobacterium symbiont of Taylorina sp.]
MSLLEYYQENKFNPVPIEVSDDLNWQMQIQKRRNLYDNHLGIPLNLLKDKNIIEFGCNSGENALVLAHYGANLTLVEPNDIVLPRLHKLFQQHKLKHKIEELVNTDINSFQTEKKFDLVIAEGFVNCLENRDEVVIKLLKLLKTGGILIISFDDRYGSLLECTRQLVLHRCLRLNSIKNVHSEKSLSIAKQLFNEDFMQINTSRPFKAWWQDGLINPYFSANILWSFQELLPLVAKNNAVISSCSPKWNITDYYSWYKNIETDTEKHQRFISSWNKYAFEYFLTGIKPNLCTPVEPSSSVLSDTRLLLDNISSYIKQDSLNTQQIIYPDSLDKYLSNSGNETINRFNQELKDLFAQIMHPSATSESIIKNYHSKKRLRKLWGCPYHYVSFTKE